MRRLPALCALAFLVVACGGKAAGVDLTNGSSSSGASSGGSGGGSSGGASGGGSSGKTSSGSTGGGGGSCEGGDIFDYCASDGSIKKQCCPANADCAPPAQYCDLGGGRCRVGECWPTPCGDQTCTSGEVCVVTTAGGGACMPPDDTNLCPDGKPPEGACCNRMSTTYECKPFPSKCGNDLACPCAESLCQCGGCGLGAQKNTLNCGCFYP